MASHSEESQDQSLASDGTSFPVVQDPGGDYSTLQMLMSSQSGSMGQLLPFVSTSEVMPTQGLASQTAAVSAELTLTEETFRNYVTQLQNLTSPLPSSAVMASQELSLPQSSAITTDSGQPPRISSPQLTTLTPSQIMIVSSTQLLPLSSQSQVAMGTSQLTVTSQSLTDASVSDLSTLSAPQLTTIMSQQHLTDFSVGQHDRPMTSTAHPLESLLEEAARDIREEANNGDLSLNDKSLESSRLEQESEMISSTDVFKDGEEMDESMEEDTRTLDPHGEYPETITEEWSQLFKEQITPYFGYVDTLEEAERILKVYELCTNSKFLGVKKCDKTNFELDVSKGRPFRYAPLVICGHKIPFDGVPYYHGGKGMYCCHLGSKRKEPKCRPLKNNKKRLESKKVGCMARVALRVIARFPDYKLKENTEYNRLCASQTLSKVLKERHTVVEEWRVYIMLPRATAHSNHEIISTLRLRGGPLDRRIIGRICQLVRMGLTDSATILKQVVHFAEHVLTKEGMEWKNHKDICGSRHIWWYRKQVLDLMKLQKFESSKFMDMVQEVEHISQRHSYVGFVEENEHLGAEDTSQTGNKWKKRTDLKQKKCFEKQLKDLKVACFSELETIVKCTQSCRQAEVLARLLTCIRAARETFEKELLNQREAPENDQTLQFLPLLHIDGKNDQEGGQVVEVPQDILSDIVKGNKYFIQI